MLARMVPRGQLYVMDRAGHHLQEERPYDYYRIVSGFLDCHRDPADLNPLEPCP